MAFQFIPSGNNVKNSPIVWKFENHETVYQSEQARFERNVEFWRNKNGFSSVERVVTINGDFKPVEYTEFEDVKPNCDTCKDNFDDCTCKDEYIEFDELEDALLEEEALIERFIELKEEIKDEQPITNEPVDSTSISKSDAQSSISQDTKASIDTPRRKPRKKTS